MCLHVFTMVTCDQEGALAMGHTCLPWSNICLVCSVCRADLMKHSPQLALFNVHLPFCSFKRAHLRPGRLGWTILSSMYSRVAACNGRYIVDYIWHGPLSHMPHACGICGTRYKEVTSWSNVTNVDKSLSELSM